MQTNPRIGHPKIKCNNFDRRPKLGGKQKQAAANDGRDGDILINISRIMRRYPGKREYLRTVSGVAVPVHLLSAQSPSASES